jgi:ABC-type nitrate/sulfonate/bicarbonate transport system substrate-binding protein
MQTSIKIEEVWYTPCPVPSASNIAVAKGWLQDEFKEAGVRLSHISTLPVRDWFIHQTHKHPRFFRDGGNIPPIWAKSDGADTKVIGMVLCNRGQAILVKKDSQIKSVKDLKGKKVALLRRLGNIIDFARAATKRAILMSLKVHGLKESDIQFIDIPIDFAHIATERTVHLAPPGNIKPKPGWKLPDEPAVEALQKGDVDAIWANGGDEFILEEAGVAKVLYNKLPEYTDLEYQVNINYPLICTVSTSLANERPDLVVRWMKALIKAGRWAKEHHDEALSIAAKAQDIPEEPFRKSYPPDFNKNLVPEISDKGIKGLEIEKNFLKEQGFINNDFDVKSWVDRRFLDAAMKEL